MSARGREQRHGVVGTGAGREESAGDGEGYRGENRVAVDGDDEVVLTALGGGSGDPRRADAGLSGQHDHATVRGGERGPHAGEDLVAADERPDRVDPRRHPRFRPAHCSPSTNVLFRALILLTGRSSALARRMSSPSRLSNPPAKGE
jgi:hypothetical protein